MKAYLDLDRHVLANGEKKSDRTGTGTLSVFGYQYRLDLRDGFPLLTTKKVVFDNVVRELLWFIKGAQNTYDGLKPECKIWDAWSDETGHVGKIYGYQWRYWEKAVPLPEAAGTYCLAHIDQLASLIEGIQKNPDSRRHIVSAWNPGNMDEMALPPCHAFFQFYVVNGYLDCQLYQRSADIAVGVPFNIASYALLLMMVAQECRLQPRYYVHTFGDAHIYLDHLTGLEKQLVRMPCALPQVTIANKPFFDLTFGDIVLDHYHPHPFISFPVAV